jgi:RNA polymerase sigma-70 factor (ECF subfamily)
MSERELVKRAKAGDFEAFNGLVKAHADRIYRLALKVTRNREDAEDVVQNTFLKAVDKIDSFRGESSFGTWVYSIALNEIRSHISSGSKMIIKPIEDYLPAGHEEGAKELFDWGDPHTYMEDKQLQRYIDDALEEMPDKYSVPFVLRYMEEMSVKEIAELLNLSVAATKSRILRARLALRQSLSDHFEEAKHERV